MKFILQVLLIALFSYLAEMVFPWWSAVLVAFIVGALIPSSGFKVFLSGFTGVGVLWLLAAFLFSYQTDYMLTQKVAQLMQLGNSSLLIALTGLIGGLSGGLGAVTGYQLRVLLRSRKKTSRYRSYH